MDDRALIQRLLDGDRTAIDLVRGWIRAACTPYGHLRDERDDLEQEVLVELLDALRGERFHGRSRLETYVKSYLHHKAIDRLRAARRRHFVDLGELDLPSPRPSKLDEMEHSEKVRVALRVAGEMPETCRELWRLIEQGLSYQEMSHRLGITEGALRVRVLRCRKRALEARERFFSQRGCNESPPSTTKQGEDGKS